MLGALPIYYGSALNLGLHRSLVGGHRAPGGRSILELLCNVTGRARTEIQAATSNHRAQIQRGTKFKSSMAPITTPDLG